MSDFVGNVPPRRSASGIFTHSANTYIRNESADVAYRLLSWPHGVGTGFMMQDYPSESCVKFNNCCPRTLPHPLIPSPKGRGEEAP